jgi:hypothetical protein
MKRSFRQKAEGLLEDRIVDDDGTTCGHVMPDPRPRKPEDREMLLERVARGKRDLATQDATSALAWAKGPDVLEARLDGLENGAAPSVDLLSYLDDPRVRPAILSAAARMRLVEDQESNVLQVLGIIGGEEAKAMLRAAIEGFLAHPLLWKDDEFCNWYASALLTACEGLLELDADATIAADAMVRMYEHPCALVRRKAVASSSTLLRRRRTRTQAFDRIRHAFRPMLEADTELFLCAADALWPTTNEEAFLARCKEILHNGTALQQQRVSHILATLPYTPWPKGTLDIVIGKVREGSLYQAFQLPVWDFLPPDLVESLARRGLAHESPWIRYQAVHIMKRIPSDVADALADEARRDEPDPVIVWLLDQRAHGAHGASA